VQGLDRSRFEPRVVLAREGPLLEELREQGCPAEVLAPTGPLAVYGGKLLEAGLVRKLQAAVHLHRYSNTMARWLGENRIELLHCNQTRAALQASIGAGRAGVPMIWNVLLRESLPAWLVKLGERYAERIVVNARGALDDFPGAELLKRKCTYVPNGVDMGRFSPEVDGAVVRAELGLEAGEPMILSAGVLMARKGHDVLIGAAPRILSEFPGARLVIAGGPPDRRDEGHAGELQQLCAELGVGESVRLVGRREDMPEMLAACEVYVLASRAEGSPAGVLEAMATARPVVVTPPAAAAVEDGVNGVVVPAEDPEALAEAVVELLREPARARQMGAAGREHVKAHHSVEAMVRGYEQVYAQVLAGSGA
jgi:glycosyltransferase involved in cell wall biosynthesis